MAGRTDTFENNAPGEYSVDFKCIGCDGCRETAPNNFRADEDEGHSYFFCRPGDAEEEARSQEAMESCPVEAIDEDGEES